VYLLLILFIEYLPPILLCVCAVGVSIVEHEGIFERNIHEHLGLANIHNRTECFLKWLAARPEPVIVVVGHSAFFRALVQLPGGKKMNNCEVLSAYLECIPDATAGAGVQIVADGILFEGGAALLRSETSNITRMN
jgi:hypothetical protein